MLGLIHTSLYLSMCPFFYLGTLMSLLYLRGELGLEQGLCTWLVGFTMRSSLVGRIPLLSSSLVLSGRAPGFMPFSWSGDSKLDSPINWSIRKLLKIFYSFLLKLSLKLGSLDLCNSILGFLLNGIHFSLFYIRFKLLNPNGEHLGHDRRIGVAYATSIFNWQFTELVESKYLVLFRGRVDDGKSYNCNM